MADEKQLWSVHQLVVEWIKLADVKAAAVLASTGVLMTVSFNKILPARAEANGNGLLLTVAGLTLAAALYTLWHVFTCLKPRLDVKAPHSLIFFYHIAGYSTSAEYQEAVEKAALSEGWLADQLAHQVWANAKVASYKHQAVSKAIRYFILTLAFVGVLGLVRYFNLTVPTWERKEEVQAVASTTVRYANDH